MGLLVTSIQRMCFHDGPGIRTTVFLKGCVLHCPWCSNPENIYEKKQNWYKEEICLKNLGKSEICAACLRADILRCEYDSMPDYFCPFDAVGVYGRVYESHELFAEMLKDEAYWINGGGVTFSGGEPLLQADGLKSVLLLLKDANIHTAVETSLFGTKESIEAVVEHIDLFIIDIKILNDFQCEHILGIKANQYLVNLEYLYPKKKNIVFRIPCSNEVTFARDNLRLLEEFIKQYNDIKIELFPVHTLGNSKYRSLGVPLPREYPVDGAAINELKDYIISCGGEVSLLHMS